MINVLFVNTVLILCMWCFSIKHIVTAVLAIPHISTEVARDLPACVSVWTFPEAFSSSAFAVLSMYLACLPFEEEGGGGYRGDIMKMDDAVTLG